MRPLGAAAVFWRLGQVGPLKNAPLKYRPSIRLNLKLFSFMTCSPVDKPPEIHKEQYELLAEQLQSRLQSRSSSLEKSEVRERLEELLQGFQGAGFTHHLGVLKPFDPT